MKPYRLRQKANKMSGFLQIFKTQLKKKKTEIKTLPPRDNAENGNTDKKQPQEEMEPCVSRHNPQNGRKPLYSAPLRYNTKDGRDDFP